MCIKIVVMVEVPSSIMLWFSIFCISAPLEISCWEFFFMALLVHIFLEFQGQNHSCLVWKSLYYCIKLSRFFVKFDHSFLIISLCKFVFKNSSGLHVCCLLYLLSFSGQLGIIGWQSECIVAVVLFWVPEIRMANIHRMMTGSHMLASKGASVNHDTQICYLCLTFIFINIRHFSWIVYSGYTRPQGFFFITCVLITGFT